MPRFLSRGLGPCPRSAFFNSFVARWPSFPQSRSHPLITFPLGRIRLIVEDRATVAFVNRFVLDPGARLQAE